MVDVAIADKSGKLRLDLPLMTANMDSVTEDAMANFIGAKGGIGVIHRFMTIEANVGIFKACQERTFVSIGCSPEDLERAAWFARLAFGDCADSEEPPPMRHPSGSGFEVLP